MEQRLAEIEPKLLPWQVPWARDMLKCLRTNWCVLDASDTGLGKTAVAIAMGHATRRKLAVVTSKWARPQWWELMRVLGYSGAIDVQHWEAVRLEKTCFGKWNNGRTRTFQWGLQTGNSLIVFDEIHNAGGINTLNSKIVMGAKAAGFPCIGLSATVADTPLRMKALGYMLGLFPTPNHYWAWSSEHGCFRNKWNGWEFQDHNGVRIRSIHRSIFGDGRGVRVRKDSIPDFPECIAFPEAIDCSEATEEIERKYRDLAEAVDQYSQKLLSMKDAKDIILRLRQKIEILKIPTLVEMCEAIKLEGGSPIVFVNYRDTAIRLADKLHCGLLIGGMGDQEHAEIVRDFMESPQKALVGTYGAGSESINLQDKKGNSPRTGILCPTHSSRALRQAEGRFHRAGGKSTSTMRMVYAANTIEIGVMRRGIDKLTKLDQLQDGEAMPFPLPPELA